MSRSPEVGSSTQNVSSGTGSTNIQASDGSTVIVNLNNAEKEIFQIDSDGSDDQFAMAVLYLLCDQFKNGVWGASIDSTKKLYGAKSDPGSISVSVDCALALDGAIRNTTRKPINVFREYLLERRSSNGAFGMMRSIGSSAYPDIVILEHARHTAAALRFFLHFDGLSHYATSGALNYLLARENRTPNGLWVDTGDRIDGRVDPITVSTIISVLENVRDTLKISDETDEGNSSSIDTAISDGLEYLFNCRFVTEDGMWLYRFETEQEEKSVKTNAYRYTAGVLSCIAPTCIRLGRFEGELEKKVSNLRKVSSAYSGGLPASALSNTPSLDATVNLFRAHISLAGQNHDLVMTDLLSEVANYPDVFVEAMAPGWASFVQFQCQFQNNPKLRPIPAEALISLHDRLRNLAARDFQIIGISGPPFDLLRDILNRTAD